MVCVYIYGSFKSKSHWLNYLHLTTGNYQISSFFRLSWREEEKSFYDALIPRQTKYVFFIWRRRHKKKYTIFGFRSITAGYSPKITIFFVIFAYLRHCSLNLFLLFFLHVYKIPEIRNVCVKCRFTHLDYTKWLMDFYWIEINLPLRHLFRCRCINFMDLSLSLYFIFSILFTLLLLDLFERLNIEIQSIAYIVVSILQLFNIYYNFSCIYVIFRKYESC